MKKLVKININLQQLAKAELPPEGLKAFATYCPTGSVTLETAEEVFSFIGDPLMKPWIRSLCAKGIICSDYLRALTLTHHLYKWEKED